MVVLYNELSCVYICTIHLTVLCIYRDIHGMSMYIYIYMYVYVWNVGWGMRVTTTVMNIGTML